MQYSFTKPHKKTLLETNSKIWLIFFGAALSILVVYTVFIYTKLSSMTALREEYTAKREVVLAKIDEIDQEMERMREEKRFAEEEVFASNVMLKESVSNLFDLIPDQVTLTKVEMDDKSLIINGVTPSKEVYHFLLSVPLKSIFNDSQVKFYLMPNSWYNFESVNTIMDN